MKKALAGILSICIIGATSAGLYGCNLRQDNANSYVALKSDYKEINKTINGFIFTGEGKLVKKVPIKIIGKQYKETSKDRDYFAGTIEVDGETTEISSTKDKDAVLSDFDTQNFYLTLNPAIGSEKGVIEHTASITISKDFNTVYGFTPNITKSYGQFAFFKSDKSLKTPQDESIEYTKEAAKRVDLYVAVMKAAFQKENGGNGFIAVKEETLEGFKEEKSKQNVLECLKSLSSNVYWYEGVRDDKSLFEFDENGRITRTINGTLLSIKVEEFKGNEAVIEATSWFGNLGAVFPKYKAVYRGGQWHLEIISMAIS